MKRELPEIDPSRLPRAGTEAKGGIHLYGGWAKRISAALLTLGLLLAYTSAALAEDVSGKRLVPVGHTVGVKLFSRGVMVVKLPDDRTPAKACGLRTGDVIVKCGGAAVTSAEQFRALLQSEGEQAAQLEVQRDGGAVTLSVEPERTQNGDYWIGAWIRDSMAGIGTMTWYDPETRTFGALGHGITDVDTAALMPFYHGSVLPSTVKAVKRGERGSAGELRGAFDLTRDLGPLYANTDRGIFGTLETEIDASAGEALPTGMPHTGPARILSNVSGDEVNPYEICIEKVSPDAEDGREMVLSVTDDALLAKTGGIVQGMSGSPIVQDGCLVGAVTHVLLQDPARGYGISIESMLRAA